MTMMLHLHDDGHGSFEDSTNLVYGECSYNPSSNTWDVTLKNSLDKNNVLKAAEITVHGWIRGRFDTYRAGEDEPRARGRAFGSMITTDIIPGETLRLHITQDPAPETKPWVKPELVPQAQEVIDVKQRLADLQRQILEIEKQL